MQKQIVVTIDRIEGSYAILKHRGDEILWPIEDLPTDAIEGNVLTLTAMVNKKAEEDRLDLAKNVLNDLAELATGTTPPPESESTETRIAKEESEVNKKLEEEKKKIDEENKKLDELNKKMDNFNK